MWDVGRRCAIPCATALLFSFEQDQGTSPSSPGATSQAASTSLPLPAALHRERERCPGRRTQPRRAGYKSHLMNSNSLVLSILRFKDVPGVAARES